MVKRVTALALLGFASSCADLDPAVLYRCEPANSCLQAGFTCWSDGYCRPGAEPPDSGSGGGGGAIGGGGGALGGGGGAVGGGGGAMGGGGGAMGGGGGAMGGGGGSGCTPCPSSSCGYFDAGCGEVYCGGCAAGTECGVSRANRCDTPRLCSRDGWCFENPLPQGNTIRGAWAAGPREVYLVGDNATALLWNGERHSVISLPALADGVDFFGVHGTSPQDLFIVGSRGTVLHFDGASWTRESIQGGSSAAYHAVLARNGSPAIAVGSNNSIIRRQQDAGWRDDLLTDGLLTLNGLGPDPEGRLFALGTYPSLSRAALMRERDAGTGSVTWDRASRPPLINGNAVWVSPDAGFFIAGLADAGMGQRVGMILQRTEDGGWDEVLRVPDEVRALTGTSEALFAVGDNGLFVHASDAGVRIARAGSQWNALALTDQGPLVEGRAGQVARYVAADGGLPLFSAGTTLSVNQLCASNPQNLFAASQGTPGCMGSLCTSTLLERTTAGGTRWTVTPLSLPDSSEFTGCGAFVDFRWLIGDDSRYTDFVTSGWQVLNPLTQGLPRTSSTSIWIQSGVSVWITNRTQPAPGGLPHVTHAIGTPLFPTHRAVSYDGGGDLITAMGGELNGGWALGQRGLTFRLESDGGLTPAPRLGSEDFTAIAASTLIDGGTLAIATGLNGALYREEGVAGFVAEPNLEADFLATWVDATGDSYVVGADISDGGRRVSRVYRRVGSSWVTVPFAGDRPLNTVWASTLPDGGHSVWVGASGGWILSH